MGIISKRYVRAATVIGMVAALTTGLAGTATAAPVSRFGPYFGSSGETAGSITWFNRSVGIQGYVTDYAGGPTTTVHFFFWQAGELIGGPESRGAVNRQRSFNFTQQGPSGGITAVEIFLCNNDDLCELKGTINRPPGA